MSILDFKKIVSEFISHPCFTNNCFFPSNPYQRAIRQEDVLSEDFTQAITYDEINTNKNLLVQKLLLVIYEQDLLLIDGSLNTEDGYHFFQSFYDPYFVSLGKQIKPTLEKCAFSFLDQSIEIIGDWSSEKLTQYLSDLIYRYESQPNALCTAIRLSNNPALAVQNTLIQMAPDFLTEASAMGRALLGSFGIEQSELMKIFIDEYGYGIHHVKHSTLFEKTMRSAGLSSAIHAYYNDYLATSMMLGNYFHYVCSNRALHFRHLGALYYSEAVIPHFNREVSATLKSLIPDTDTAYFDEHVHIDMYHHRMALEKIIMPCVKKYGETIITDVLMGIESQQLLLQLAESDFIAQLRFIDQINARERGITVDFHPSGVIRYFNEIKHEITSAHIHHESEFFSVHAGSLLFYPCALAPVLLNTGDSIVIPKERLHSTIVQSDNVRYSVQSIRCESMRVSV